METLASKQLHQKNRNMSPMKNWRASFIFSYTADKSYYPSDHKCISNSLKNVFVSNYCIRPYSAVEAYAPHSQSQQFMSQRQLIQLPSSIICCMLSLTLYPQYFRFSLSSNKQDLKCIYLS